MMMEGRLLVLLLFSSVLNGLISATITSDMASATSDGSHFSDGGSFANEERGIKGSRGNVGPPGEAGLGGDQSLDPSGQDDTGLDPSGLDNTSGLDDSGTANTRKVHACEGSTLKFRCAPTDRIHVVDAVYGRLSGQKCDDKLPDTQRAHWDYSCNASQALVIVRKKCENAVACSIEASNDVFTDPCNATPKYLDVTYLCQQDSFTSVFAESETPRATAIEDERSYGAKSTKLAVTGDSSTNPWLIACILLACINAVLLVAFPICLYLLITYFRSKLNISSEEISNAYLQILQDDRSRSNEEYEEIQAVTEFRRENDYEQVNANETQRKLTLE